ncbi:putative reverse transcriptase domain-containing protein [Tanacetum coccineum]
MCGRMFLEESDEVKKYVSGLPNMIWGNMMPKRKIEFNAGNNQGYQQQNKRQNTGRAYTAGTSEKREYTGSGQTIIITIHGTPGATRNAVTCYECGVQGHIKRDCPKLKNGNRGNQRWNDNAPAKVYVVGNAGTNPTLIGLVSKKPTQVIDCAKKNTYELPWGNETLIVHGDGSNQGNGTRLNIISCTKTNKYLLKRHHVFLANITAKETEDRSGEKRLEDVPIIQDFPEFLTLGRSSLVCQEEGLIISDVHRLSGIKQADGEESLSSPHDDDLFDQLQDPVFIRK